MARCPPRRTARRTLAEGLSLSARDDGNSGIRHSCAHMRGHARSLNPLARGCLIRPDAKYGPMRIAPGDTAARGCARQLLEPFPRRLRPPSFERRNTAFARRGPSPRHHASADLDSVDSPSRRSANARGVTVDSICTSCSRSSERWCLSHNNIPRFMHQSGRLSTVRRTHVLHVRFLLVRRAPKLSSFQI